MKNARFVRRVISVLLTSLGLLAGACADDFGVATLRIAVYGEEFIEDQIPAEVLVDGWGIRFDRFLIAIAELEADGVPLEGTFVADLARPSDGEGHGLGTLDLPPGGSPQLAFRVAPVPADVTPVALPDVDPHLLVDAGASLWVEGEATKDGETRTFAWAFTTDTRYVECESTAPLVDGAEATSQLTIHADHLFYDDLDSETPNVAFELVASADADGSGDVTEQELRALDITGQARYQVGSRDVTELWSFIETQTGTIGHIDGEGHCELGS